MSCRAAQRSSDGCDLQYHAEHESNTWRFCATNYSFRGLGSAWQGHRVHLSRGSRPSCHAFWNLIGTPSRGLWQRPRSQTCHHGTGPSYSHCYFPGTNWVGLRAQLCPASRGWQRLMQLRVLASRHYDPVVSASSSTFWIACMLLCYYQSSAC